MCSGVISDGLILTMSVPLLSDPTGGPEWRECWAISGGRVLRGRRLRPGRHRSPAASRQASEPLQHRPRIAPRKAVPGAGYGAECLHRQGTRRPAWTVRPDAILGDTSASVKFNALSYRATSRLCGCGPCWRMRGSDEESPRDRMRGRSPERPLTIGAVQGIGDWGASLARPSHDRNDAKKAILSPCAGARLRWVRSPPLHQDRAWHKARLIASVRDARLAAIPFRSQIDSDSSGWLRRWPHPSSESCPGQNAARRRLPGRRAGRAAR